MQFLIDNVHR